MSARGTRWTLRRRARVLLGAAVALVASAAGLRADLSMALVEEPRIGRYFSGSSGRNFVLQTDGSVSGPDAADYIDGALAGRFTVTDTAAPASIVILVDNIATSGGLSVNEATCSYDGRADGRCDGTGLTETSVASALLRVGLDVVTTQAHDGGETATVSMDVSVTYL